MNAYIIKTRCRRNKENNILILCIKCKIILQILDMYAITVQHIWLKFVCVENKERCRHCMFNFVTLYSNRTYYIFWFPYVWSISWVPNIWNIFIWSLKSYLWKYKVGKNVSLSQFVYPCNSSKNEVSLG